MSVKALAVHQAQHTLKPYEFDFAALAADEVEVTVSHCGICHSDLHLIDNDWGISEYPLVPGHEIIGQVCAVGDNVKQIAVGQLVGIGWQCDACLDCQACNSGNENLCGEHQAVANGHFGGFAEKVRANKRFVFPIPDGLSAATAAPLLCGGVTVFSPFYHHKIQAIHKVGVIGIGGLGHLALQYANAFGCEVVALSHSENKQAQAKHFGAHHFVNTNDAQQLEQHAGSIDFIISTACVELDWAPYINLLAPQGKICLVGVSDKMTIPLLPMIMQERAVCTSLIGNSTTITKMLSFSARHNIQAQTQLFPMSQANEALAIVRDNNARYRIVLENDL